MRTKFQPLVLALQMFWKHLGGAVVFTLAVETQPEVALQV
jgi:hypothetical protein